MYKIPADLLQAVVNYLTERPFREVASFVGALTQLQQIPETPSEVGEATLAEVVELQVDKNGEVVVEDAPEA